MKRISCYGMKHTDGKIPNEHFFRTIQRSDIIIAKNSVEIARI